MKKKTNIERNLNEPAKVKRVEKKNSEIETAQKKRVSRLKQRSYTERKGIKATLGDR